MKRYCKITGHSVKSDETDTRRNNSYKKKKVARRKRKKENKSILIVDPSLVLLMMVMGVMGVRESDDRWWEVMGGDGVITGDENDGW